MTVKIETIRLSEYTAFRVLASSPVWCAFIGSLLLSAIAIYGAEIPNRDGILYIDTAAIFLEDGLAAARANFDWVFLPACIAIVSKVTSLGLETAAYALNALLMAGVCATLVRITQVQSPSAVWYACLVVLVLPKFNDQRDEIIREFGWWLFCLLSLLAALRWQQRPGYGRGLLVQLLLAMACLFRVEGAIFFAALALWQIRSPFPWKQRLWRMATLLCLPAAIALLLLGLLSVGQIDAGERIAEYMSAANPLASFAKFNAAASEFGSTILNPYSTDDASRVLFFGLLSIVPYRFVMNYGILLIPCAMFLWGKGLRHRFAEWRLPLYFFAVYALTLIAFVMWHFFTTNRYVIFLNLLLVPFIALGLQDIFERYVRWKYVFLLIAVVAALANVVSSSPRKTQFREAGAWIAAHPELVGKIYIDSPRVRYCAGPVFRVRRNDPSQPKNAEEAVSDSRFGYIVFELSKHNVLERQKITTSGFIEEKQFTSASGNAVTVLRRDASAAIEP
ncbi:MAG: hypothetical protein LBV29_08375 [Azoarcus sp.]|jgi:hypothetical protein|nr:hypothetical protein [Azoarcus sp.]